MARHHKGNFKAKHPPDTTIAPEVLSAVAARIAEGRGHIPCRSAFSLAEELSVSPLTIGTAIDLQEGRITRCQLGLFGYNRDRPLLNAHTSDDDGLKADIETGPENNRLSCKRAWELADRQRRSRVRVAAVCESLGIRISECQLGAF